MPVREKILLNKFLNWEKKKRLLYDTSQENYKEKKKGIK